MGNEKQVTWESNEIGCHLVNSHMVGKNGYVYVKRDGKKVLLHRWMYEKFVSEIPNGLQVRHKCDNRRCVNLDHLELGTNQDNVNDKMSRGRYVHVHQQGSLNYNSILNDQIVREILSDLISSNIALGKKYNVSHQTISLIRKRKIWSHVIM